MYKTTQARREGRRSRCKYAFRFGDALKQAGRYLTCSRREASLKGGIRVLRLCERCLETSHSSLHARFSPCVICPHLLHRRAPPERGTPPCDARGSLRRALPDSDLNQLLLRFLPWPKSGRYDAFEATVFTTHSFSVRRLRRQGRASDSRLMDS